MYTYNQTRSWHRQLPILPFPYFLCFSLYFLSSYYFFTRLPCLTIPLKRKCEFSLVKKKNSQETVPTTEKIKLKQHRTPKSYQAFLPLQTLLQKLHCASHSQSNCIIDNVGKEVNKRSHAHFKPLRNTGQRKIKSINLCQVEKNKTSRDWSSTFSF